MANRTKRTLEKGEKFIETLRRTGGNVSRACKAEGIGRTMAYEWRATDEEFARKWDEAVEGGLDDLEQEAVRRALKGTKKPVYQKGMCVGYIQEYSDTLMMFMLKGGRPAKFRERVEHSGKLDISDPKRLALDLIKEWRAKHPDLPLETLIEWAAEEFSVSKAELVSEAVN